MTDQTAKERMRRYRQRLKDGTVPIQADMSYSLAGTLIASGVLSEKDSFDPRKRGEALLDYIRKTKG